MTTYKRQFILNIFKWALFLVLALLIIFLSLSVRAQMVSDMEDESRLYAETKQVNQFFRRFNGEEDEKGNRYYPGDKYYQSVKLRKKYLSILFDASNTGISNSLKKEFIDNVLDKPEASILDFHSRGWFSEVTVLFRAAGKDQRVTLYMELEKSHLGYKWVIHKAYSDAFVKYFVRDTTRVGRFLHPMSHELDFMNLRKALANSDSLSQFAGKDFVPDHLSILLYELKKGNLVFKSVENVSFHVFQIAGWYFQLSDFNRPGYNKGWLIDNLVKLKNESEKDLMKKYLYNEPK